MKLTPKDIESLKSALAATRVVGVEGVVFNDGKVMGARISLDAAIISPCEMSFDSSFRLGVGRVDELEKRLALFDTQDYHHWVQNTDGSWNCSKCSRFSKTNVGIDGNNMTAGKTCPVNAQFQIEGKVSDAGDVSLLTISMGKTKVQFRCTSAALMKYPKKNNDPAFAVVYLSRAEAQQASKAAKSLKSDRLLLQVGRDGNVRLECVDSSNDRFEIELAKQADYMDEADSAVHSYIANVLTDVLDAAAKDAEEISLILGADGSITTTARGHELIVFPQINGEEE